MHLPCLISLEDFVVYSHYAFLIIIKVNHSISWRIKLFIEFSHNYRFISTVYFTRILLRFEAHHFFHYNFHAVIDFLLLK